MNNDGWGQSGVGSSDMKVAGVDLQHARNKRLDVNYERFEPVSQMDVHEALANENDRHAASKKMRIEHLQKAYKR